MKKTYLALALGSVMFAQVNAVGVPTFDSVDVALEMRNLAEQLVRNYTQYEQYTKQLEQYKNQFGETSDLLDKLQNLEFVDSSYGYVPANPKEAIEVLTGVSKHMPENIKAIEKEIQRQYYKKGVDEFVNAGREK